MPILEPMQDFIKALREARSLLLDVVGDVIKVQKVLEQSKGKKVARSLDTLTFQSKEARQHLEKIASGQGRTENFIAIAEIMEGTGANIEEHIDFLKNHRDFIREKYGLSVANRLMEMLYGGGGKQSIRFDLWGLVFMGDDFYPSEDIAVEANRILDNISELNSQLEELHDMLLSITPNKVA